MYYFLFLSYIDQTIGSIHNGRTIYNQYKTVVIGYAIYKGGEPIWISSH